MAKFLIHNSRVYPAGDTGHTGPSVSLQAFSQGQSPAAPPPPRPHPKPRRMLTLAAAVVKQGLLGCCGYQPGDCHCGPATLSNTSLRVNAAPPAPREAPRRLLECKACHHISCICPPPSMQTFEERRAQAAKDAVARRGW